MPYAPAGEVQQPEVTERVVQIITGRKTDVLFL